MTRRGDISIFEAEKILELTSPYTLKFLNERYRSKAKENHPDLGGDPQKMMEVNQAFERLKPLFNGNENMTRTPLTSDDSPHSSYSSSSYSYSNSEYDQAYEDIWEEVFRDLYNDYHREAQSRNRHYYTGDYRTDPHYRASYDGSSYSSNYNGNKDNDKKKQSDLTVREKIARVFYGLRHVPWMILCMIYCYFVLFTMNQSPNGNMFSMVSNGITMLIDMVITVPLIGFGFRFVVRKILTFIGDKISGAA